MLVCCLQSLPHERYGIRSKCSFADCLINSDVFVWVSMVFGMFALVPCCQGIIFFLNETNTHLKYVQSMFVLFGTLLSSCNLTPHCDAKTTLFKSVVVSFLSNETITVELLDFCLKIANWWKTIYTVDFSCSEVTLERSA